ncbi:MAG: hypothetical protein V2B15_06760 [Bacteroidota bacterium]
MKITALFIIIGMGVSGCVWDNEETLFPGPDICDTLDVSYAMDVVPIMADNCYSCHSNANAPGFALGITLEDYADVKASSNSIIGAIKHSDGFPAMPRGADPLDTCSISRIEAWVNAGSPEN